MHTVVVAALVRAGQVCLVHRRPDRDAYPDVWDLPGGHVEPGETELDALSRELHEELGVVVAADTAVHLCRVDVGAGNAPVLLSAWLVTQWQGTPTNVAPHEHDAIGWFTSDGLPALADERVGAAVAGALGGGPA